MSNYEVLKDVLALAKNELNENGNVGYTLPGDKYHIFIYVDEGTEGKLYTIEPNRIINGAMEPMGNTTAADYNDFAEVLLGVEWCLEQFERDKEIVFAQVNEIADTRAELEFTGLVNGKYEIDDFYHDVDYASRYLLDRCFRNPEQSERLYEVIKDKVRSEAIGLQEGRDFHIDDTDVAHTLANVMENLVNKAIELENDKNVVLTQANAVGDPRIEFDLGAVKLVAEPNCDKDYKEIIIGLMKDGVYHQDLAVIGPEYTYKFEVDDCHPVLDEKKIAVRVYSDKDNEDYTHKFSVDVWDERDEHAHQLGMRNEGSFVAEGEKQDLKEYEHKGDKEMFDGSFKYWSNACGELHKHGEYDITEDELPEPLKRAYKELWGEGYSSLCYLVETADGYGVALINEYDDYTASVKECTMDELFSVVQGDKEKVLKVPYYQNAKVYAGDYTGCNECHELVVVFPADTPFEEFDVAAKALEFLTYDSPVVRSRDSVCEKIRNAETQKTADDKAAIVNKESNHEL